MEQYQISDLPSRYQLAQHFHSSLDQPNLDNVEAKLYAIRQKNYQMAQQFFQQKYGSSVAYDQYLQQSNMTDLKPPKSPFQQYQNQFDLKHHLAQKAFQIQQQQMQKISRGQGKVVNKRPNSSKKNPWLQNKTQQSSTKNNQKRNSDNYAKNYDEPFDIFHQKLQPQEDEMSIQVVNLKQTKEQQNKGKFISQFKQYLANKKRLQSASKQPNQFQQSPKKSNHLAQSLNNNSLLTQSHNINESQIYGGKNKSFMNDSSNIQKNKSFNDSNVNTSAEQQLVKKIFKTLHSKKAKDGKVVSSDYVQKIQLAEYLTSNQRILDVLKIGAEQIVERLHKQLQTKDPNKVKFHQCLMFVYQLLGKQQEQRKLFAKHCFNDIPEGCMLQPEVIKQFQKIFKQLDKPCDLIVKRLEFIQRLALDPMLSKILNTPAVFQPILNKPVSLRRIFERIQVQTLLCAQQQIKAKQYISWGQFIKYFQSGHTNRAGYDILSLVQSLKNQQKMGFADIPQTVYDVICQAVTRLDKKQQYFNTQQLIGQILINKIFEVQKYSFVRGKGNDPKSGNIPMETFEQTLMRIKQTAPKFVSIKEFLQFFSVKGRPIQLIEQQMQSKIKAANQSSKIATMQQQIFGNQPHQIDGYDSDPEFYNNSQLIDRKQFRKTFADAKKNLLNSKNHQSDTQSNDIQINTDIKITVPKPFKFQQRQKQRAQQREKNKLNRSASLGDRSLSQFKFKAKQIPNKVKQKGLYQQMLEEDRKRIQDRRKCSMLLTLANQQPFSFYDRKAPKKTKQERQQFQFKANPIPWYCSVNLLKKKEQKEIYRNQKIARMAQQSLSKAKLPPRMEKDFQQKLARKNLQQTKKNQRPQSAIKAKEPPNFELLHKQFQTALQRKRKQNKTTQIKQFNFQQIKRQKKPAKDAQFQQQNLAIPKQAKQQKWRQTLKSSINVFASSTAKFDQQVQKRRKQMQEKKKKQDQKRKQEEQRNRINNQLNKKLQDQIKMKKQNAKQSQILEQRKKQLKQQQEDFKVRKAQWISNASKQPLLVQRPLKRDIQKQKMKKLYLISQNLKKNGIKGKQHDQYFKRDQLLLLKDCQFLLQKGQKLWD